MSTQTSLAGSTLETDENDVRVEDYLNDKLQTHADLEGIDSLLEDIRGHQAVLKQQLAEAESFSNDASQSFWSHSSSLAQKARAFKQNQTAIDRRLLIVTQSETSDDAVPKFNDSMEKLRRLDVAKSYVDLLSTVEQLSSEARQNFKSSPRAALIPYLKIQNLSNTLKQAQPAAEDAAPHLVDYVENRAKLIWTQMKDAFASDFEATLKKMKWPGKDLTMDENLLQEWSAGAERLLELQEPELNDQEKTESQPSARKEALVLLPLEVMVKPLAMRFRYHFEGDRPTNRLDKPEYFLSHVVNLLNTYEEFFAVYLQPILLQHFKGSNLALNSVYIDSTSALITALLPFLREKISTVLPQVSNQPQLFSHLIHEIMTFDANMRDDWGYDGGQGVEGWKGLTWEILVKLDWFGKWLRVERDFALSRYDNIIKPADSGEIDYDSVDPGVTKPTKAAIRVNDLLETVTDRYRPLASLSQKLRFLIDVQISIFDKFHDRLHSSLEAYLTMTSSIGRTVQGISKEEQAQLQGIGGLDRLCRVYGSAEYLEKKMQDWSDDVFFLELWDELQFRARANSKDGRHIAKNLSIEEVAERTSSAVGTEESSSGGLFDETAGAYRRLRIRTEDIMIETMSYNLRETFRPYGRINPWSSLAPSDSAAGSALLAISAELDSLVQQLSSYLSFLAKVLSEAALRRVSRQLGLTIQAYLWDNVLMRNKFSSSGVAQFQKDVSAIWGVFDEYLGGSGGQGRLMMKKLGESIQLLSMPAATEGRTGGSGSGSDGRDGNDNDDDNDGGAKDRLGIWEVEERVYRDNESAREVLEELGMDALSESEARNILGKRIDLGS